jgi:Recombination endonuclease VII
MKLCKRCGETKPLDQFYPHNRTKDRLQYWCKSCQKMAVISGYRNDPAKHAAYNREWGRKNPHKKADIALKTRFGLPHGSYAQMFAAQNGKCAICGTDKPSLDPRFRRFHVDHDAATGKIRGLLCSRCNTGIGQLLHDRDILLSAIGYLDLYQDQPYTPAFDTDDSILAPNC